MRVRALCILFVLMVSWITSSEASQAPAPITDALIFEKDLPKTLPGVGAATQIQLNGMLNLTKYKDGLIQDADQKIKYEVYLWDPATMTVKGKALESEVSLDVKCSKTWTGITQRQGGYQPGLHSIWITVEKFRDEIGNEPAPATLVQAPFEIK